MKKRKKVPGRFAVFSFRSVGLWYKKSLGYSLISSALILCSCSSSSKNERVYEETPLTKKYYSLALQGDVKAAAAPLLRAKTKSLGEMDLVVKYNERFVEKIKPQLEAEDTFTTQVIAAYQTYWNAVLLKELTEREGFYLLFKELNLVLKPLGKDIKVYNDANLEKAAKTVEAEIKKRGHFGLFGMTRPHLELMVWKKQKNKTYRVKLHDGVQKVRVVLMDQFDSLGWAAYATFGKSFTGGWATKEKLFCVKPAYKLKSESYKVSYLKHEARHFADYKLFPKLKQPELEYRAKLSELIYAKKTIYGLIEKFKTQGKNSRVSPHAFANFHVYKNLMVELTKDPGFLSVTKAGEKKIREAALKLLRESSERFGSIPAFIIKRAAQLLKTKELWSKLDNRKCKTLGNGTSLYCALKKASLEVSGGFEHRSLAMQAVRTSIDEQYPDNKFAHRLQDFNNAAGTDLVDVHQILNMAADKLSNKNKIL